jgi:hypothetical protein
MALVEFVNAPSHCVCRLTEMKYDATRLTVMRKKFDICHLSNL